MSSPAAKGAKPLRTDPPSAPDRMPDHSPTRLLIVDDERALMQALCDSLNLEGYVTQGFVSAKEALAAIQPDRFDLLITDLMMPEMDGIALSRAATRSIRDWSRS